MKSSIIICILVLVILPFTFSKESENVETKVVLKKEKVVEPIDSTNLTKELLVSFMLSEKIAHPEVAYAIVRQESNMCSQLFKNNRNLFGMRQPGVRPTLSEGKKSGFAYFEKWQHSVLDYKLYLEFVGGHEMTRDQYLSHLDRSYAHRGYSSYIKKYFEEFELILKSL